MSDTVATDAAQRPQRGQEPGRMQVELVDRRRWNTRIELANAIFEYLEIWYSRRRRHSRRGMLRTIQFETQAAVVVA